MPATAPLKLGREFFSRPAADAVKDFLGKVLVHRTEQGTLSGIVYDVEAYPAFADGVHHGNKRTRRAEVMWGPPGHSYVYLIYGKWHQFAAVVAREEVPDVVFIRAVKPMDGIATMAAQWDRNIGVADLCNSPGKLCKSMGITLDRYGEDLCGDVLYFEDHSIVLADDQISTAHRVGINPVREGHDAPLRFFLRPKEFRQLPDRPGTAP